MLCCIAYFYSCFDGVNIRGPIMKELNSIEVNQISGGTEAIGFFLVLSMVNVGLALYNAAQISQINYELSLAFNWLEFVDNWTVYHEVQLMNLPGYNEAASLTMNQAEAIVFK
jgi:hypothetical protein